MRRNIILDDYSEELLTGLQQITGKNYSRIIREALHQYAFAYATPLNLKPRVQYEKAKKQNRSRKLKGTSSLGEQLSSDQTDG